MMNMLIFMHYFKRVFTYPLYMAIFLGVPLGFIAVNGSIGSAELVNGYNISASVTAVIMVLSFQFFGTGMIFFFLFADLKNKMRFRLNAAPCRVNRFYLSAIGANWLYSVVLGIVVIIVSSLLFNVYWGDPLVFAIVFLITSLMGSFISILIFLYAKKNSTADTIHYVICFGMMILTNVPLNIRLESRLLTDILIYINPLSIGMRAVLASGFIGDMMRFVNNSGMDRAVADITILACITLVLAVIAGISGRRRTF